MLNVENAASVYCDTVRTTNTKQAVGWSAQMIESGLKSSGLNRVFYRLRKKWMPSCCQYNVNLEENASLMFDKVKGLAYRPSNYKRNLHT